MIAGTVAKLVRRWVKAQNFPVVSAALGDYGLPLVSGYDGYGGYQTTALPGQTAVDSSIAGDESLAALYNY